jgi:hypothetical protein
MSARARFFVQPDWIGQNPSMPMPLQPCRVLTSSRIKAKLRSGEMTVPGDHWPIFLYAGYDYDPSDPWKGLFRSPLLVSVGGIVRQIT